MNTDQTTAQRNNGQYWGIQELEFLNRWYLHNLNPGLIHHLATTCILKQTNLPTLPGGGTELQ